MIDNAGILLDNYIKYGGVLMSDFSDLEKTLPRYLQNDIKALVDGYKTNSTLLDCLWCEVYGSINSAFHDRVITEEEAAYLRSKYLGME